MSEQTESKNKSDRDPADAKRAAVYLPFPTWLTVLAMLAEAMPSRIDRSVFKNLSGSAQYEIMAALKFFALIDDRGKPAPLLSKLAEADGAGRKSLMRSLLEQFYPTLFQHGLGSMTFSQFDEMIGAMNVSGATKVRAIRFFIAAAEYSGVAISTYIKAHKPASPSKTSQRSGAKKITKSSSAATTEAKKTSTNLHEEHVDSSAAPPLKTITLSNGETLSIVGRFNVFELTRNERSFLDTLIDALQTFEQLGAEAASEILVK